ncbi:MAG: hypothetical protein ACOX51_06715 [Myxococcota bacterium]|nr:hypothetical protein [Myxococcota bacterium]
MKQTHENATVKYPAQHKQVKAGGGVVIICSSGEDVIISSNT